MPCVTTVDVKPKAAQETTRRVGRQQRRFEIAFDDRLPLRLSVEAARRKEPQRPGVGVLAEGQPVQGERPHVLHRHALRDAARVRAIVSRQPVAVFVDRDSELAIDAFRRLQTVAAQIARWSVTGEALDIRIERGLALGAGGHRRRRTAARGPPPRETSGLPPARSRASPRGRTSRSPVAISTRGPPCAEARAVLHSSLFA